MASENAREDYEAPDIEQVGALSDVTFGVAPGVPVDTTFINARPISGISS